MSLSYEEIVNTFPEPWAAIVSAWAEMNETYFVQEKWDIPVWYRENTSTALFSAATWKLGHPSMCEPHATKSRRKKGQRGRPPGYDGRLDLVVKLARRGVHWIEAKAIHCDISSGSSRSLGHAPFRNQLKKSEDDALNSGRESAQWEASVHAILFFSATLDGRSFEGQNNYATRREATEEAVERLKAGLEKRQWRVQPSLAVYRNVSVSTPLSARGERCVLFGACGLMGLM